MNATTIDQACDPSNWRWKRCDVRSDGKVFWKYDSKYKSKERWCSWNAALKEQSKKTNRDAKYRLLNKNTINQRNRNYWLVNQNIKREKRNKREKLKRNLDPLVSMRTRYRCRMLVFMKRNGYSKPSKTQEMLGCDWNHLKAHLESQFVDGMSWDNRHLWHVDHIIPLASATSEEDLIRLNHYTNLQPLWASDNLSKGAKMLQ